MSDQSCQCGKPTRDQAFVCDDCLGDLAKALGNVPWLVEQLDITLTKARGIDYSALGGSPSTERPMLFPQAAYDASNALRHALHTWVRFCVEENIRNQSPRVGLPADNMRAMSAWLLWRVDGLGLSDLGSDAVSEITRAAGRAQQVIDRPAERQFDGPCECGRDLYSKPGSKTTRCKGCEREYDVVEMRTWMQAQMEGRLVTAREATTLLGRMQLPTAQRTIDKWHERGRVVDHGKNAEEKLMYLFDDLIELASVRAAS